VFHRETERIVHVIYKFRNITRIAVTVTKYIQLTIKKKLDIPSSLNDFLTFTCVEYPNIDIVVIVISVQ